MDDEVQMHERIAKLESQFERFISDAESEKRTRRVMVEELKEVASKLDDRLRHVEKFAYIAMGGVAIIEFIAKFVK